jgi:glyoxylase-like metal-dependent hydrolase (beta-lactamase superfamily II)
LDKQQLRAKRELTLSNFTPMMMLPDWDPKVLTELPDEIILKMMNSTQTHLLLSIHSWLVRDRGRTILIDTGAGNGKIRPDAPYFDHLDTPYLEQLRAAGCEPEDIDYVLLTHLHVDHVGWNTKFENGRWVPTFPNARYIFARAEYDYFTDPQNRDSDPTSFAVQKDSVDPVIEAGLADMIDVDGSEAIEGFTFYPTHGHSIAHASIIFQSGTETALFAGDVMHHPLQVFKPEWNSVFCAFPEAAQTSRAWALAFAADHQVTFFSSHFPASSAGSVERDKSGFRWKFY